MTHTTKPAPRLAAIPAAAISALLLAGCSTGHIGDSWQCPLAEGGSCDSVAAADPAVPERKAARATMLAEPLWRLQAAEPGTSPARGEPVPAPGTSPGQAPEPGGQAAEPPCPADCDGGFDPFAWLARLFQAEAHDGEARPDAGSARASSAPAMQPSDPLPGEEAALPAAVRTAEPETSALPAEPEAAEEHRGGGGPHEEDLRTGEVVARIWIAPFVDANGVYREASHVRVVLESAGWRLP